MNVFNGKKGKRSKHSSGETDEQFERRSVAWKEKCVEDVPLYSNGAFAFME